MGKILFLPVDERFCTREYFLQLSRAAGIPVSTPEKLGSKKIPADTENIRRWLLECSAPGDVAVISLEMLVHGGLIPSRIDLISEETIDRRLDVLREIKDRGVQIFAGVTVTRIPDYNSDDEEPEYWAYFGKKISEMTSAMVTGDEDKFKSIRSEIPSWVIEDFFWRRNRNFQTVQKAIRLVEKGVIDFLSITLDDNKPGSLVYAEAQKHAELVKTLSLQDRIFIRNGADEAMLTLLAKFLSWYFRIAPRFYVMFRFPESKGLIPPYESNTLVEGVKAHIEAVGGVVCENSHEADVFLVVNNARGDENSFESPLQIPSETDFRQATDFLYSILGTIEELEAGSNRQFIASFADVRYANGSDVNLVRALLTKRINWLKTNYYGWNTAGNTIGSCCAHSVIQLLGTRGTLSIDPELMTRYQAALLLEHYGYQAIVRAKLRDLVAKSYGNLQNLIPCETEAIKVAEAELKEYLEKINKVFGRTWQLKVYFPWHRTFEIGLELW